VGFSSGGVLNPPPGDIGIAGVRGPSIKGLAPTIDGQSWRKMAPSSKIDEK
jgi:hypothetical protein